MIRLGTRFAVGTGREALVRLVLTAAGITLATAMLLSAAVVFPALRAHDERRGWMMTSLENTQPGQDESTTDPLLWRLTETRFDGRDLTRIDLAAEGPDAPVPPGLGELPGAGEVAVSPALAELLDDTEPAMLHDRFAGEVVATLGRDALVSPDALVAVVGRDVDELGAEPEVLRVSSIEAAPHSRALTRVMRLAVAIGGVGLLAPVVVFVATATRLAAARREKRLAAMRLAGATPRQVGVVAAVEAALAAVVGTALGFGLFFAIRPALADIPVDGYTFFPSDLHLSWTWALVVALGVPIMATSTAIVSLRRARITPLGVARRSIRARPSPRPLLLLVVGLIGLAVVQATMTTASDVVVATAVGAVLLTMILGIVLSGPWLTAVAGRALARAGRRAPSLLAARRLQDNPTAGFRSIAGLVLAVFVVTIFSSFTASVLADEGGSSADGLAPGVVTAALYVIPPPTLSVEPGGGGTRPVSDVPTTEWPELAPAREAQIVADLDAIDGVRRAVTAYAVPDEYDRLHLSMSGIDIPGEPVAMACSDVEALGVATCEGTTLVAISAGGIDETGIDITDAVPVDRLGDRQAVAFAAVTDGSTSAVEQARTVLELGLPGSRARTQADFDADNLSTARSTQRLGNIALAVTLVIAGCSLAVAVAGSIVERRQPFALLRLAGTRLSDLRRIVLAEAAAPLLVVATASVGLGLAVTALSLQADANSPPFALPGLDYWLAFAGGLVVALGVVAATLPLLNRLTSPETVRFE